MMEKIGELGKTVLIPPMVGILDGPVEQQILVKPGTRIDSVIGTFLGDRR